MLQPGDRADDQVKAKAHGPTTRRHGRSTVAWSIDVGQEQYLQIAEWTAEQTLARSAHPPPSGLDTLVRQKELDPKQWRAAVDNFAACFTTRWASQLRSILDRLGRKWIPGIGHCAEMFSPDRPDNRR